MALVVKDRVKTTTTTTGTGTITLGSAVTGFQAFSVIGNGNTTYYTIYDSATGAWEVGLGTYSSTGPTLSRDTVLESSNAGSLVNFAAGTKEVFVTYPAEKAVYLDASDNVTVPNTLTADQLTINTLGGVAGIFENTNASSWIYASLSKSVSADETAPTGLFFRDNGTRVYVAGDTGNDITQYTLGTAWNVSTAATPVVFSVSTQDSSPQGVFFKPDGLAMYVLGGANDVVYQYTLSGAWDISTASYASKSFSVTTQEATPTGIWFKPDGTVMYIVGTTNDRVYQYTLGTAWDVSTASYSSLSFSVNAQDATPNAINFSPDGATMYVLGATFDRIAQYTLGTPWNVSTATITDFFYVGNQEQTPTGLYVSTANEVAYVVGQSSDTIFQYDTNVNSIQFDSLNTVFPNRVTVENDLYVQDRLAVGGTFQVYNATTLNTTSVGGTLTASGAVNFSTTTGNLTLGTAQTTGLLTLGGTAQTGALTIGQSTGAQTLNLGTGATTSGTTKAINIGTAGVSGSTTNIAIGSAVSGATSTTTFNGLQVYSISAAITAAGTTQAGATALISTINNVTVVASGADGVRLPTAVAGLRLLVRNSDSADTLKIYPATGAQINALAANAAYSLLPGGCIEFFATTATQWYSMGSTGWGGV